MVIYHIDMVILDIDMEYGLMTWEMTVSIRSTPISIWNILSVCIAPASASTLEHSVRFSHGRNRGPQSRGLHSSTFRLSVSAFCGIGGAFRGCLGGD